MIVYVLTDEPFHDNSEFLGVFLDRESAHAAAMTAARILPGRIDADWVIREWDCEANKLISTWRYSRKSVSDRHYYQKYILCGEEFGKIVKDIEHIDLPEYGVDDKGAATEVIHIIRWPKKENGV